MSNDTTEPKKHCLSGERCLHPDGPELPLSEFYRAKSSKNGYQSRCKICHGLQNKMATISRQGNQRGKPGYETEGMVIEELRRQGIYAAPGKSSEFHNLDVVAWGCVRIECKSSIKDRMGRYLFNFNNQRRKGISADLVVLVCLGDEITFHVFPARHGVFYKHGRVKMGVQYDPYRSHFKGGQVAGARLTTALMNQYQNAWYLIEEKRLEISAALEAAEYHPDIVVGDRNSRLI